MDNLIGENIKQARLRAGYTQEKLAEKIDVSLSVISRLETGRTMVSVAKMQRIAKVLNTPVGTFFERSFPENRTYPETAETTMIRPDRKSIAESALSDPDFDEELYTLIRQLPEKGKEFFKNALRCYIETF